MSITEKQKNISKLLFLAQDYYKSAEILMTEAQYRDSLPLLTSFFNCLQELQKIFSVKEQAVSTLKTQLTILKKLSVTIDKNRKIFPKKKKIILEESFIAGAVYLSQIKRLYCKVFPWRLTEQKFFQDILVLLKKPWLSLSVSLLVVSVLAYQTFIVSYDFFASRPSQKFYQASCGKFFFISGWSGYNKQKNERVTSGNTTIISVPIRPSSTDKELCVFVQWALLAPQAPTLKQQRIQASIGETDLGTKTILDQSFPKKISFIIPHQLITQNRTTITLDFPDAQSPESLQLSQDQCKRAISIAGISVDAVDSAPYYRLGRTILAARKSDTKYFIKGWYPPNQNYRWSVGGNSHLVIKTPKTRKNLRLEINSASALISPGIINKQKIRIYINDHFIRQIELLDTPSIEIIDIPNATFAGSSKMTISFICPDAANPTQLGRWKDNNLLSFSLKSVRLINNSN
jgi:hypothetical protein